MDAVPPICIDGRMLDVDATGVATYAGVLLATLQRQGCKPIILRAQHRPMGTIGRFLAALSPATRRITGTTVGDLIGDGDIFREAQIHFKLYGKPMMLETDQAPGVMHWTYPVPLAMRSWINLYTVHDAIPLTHPHLTDIDPARHRRLLDALIRSGGRFLTVSEASCTDIAQAMNLDAAEILVCHQGIDDLEPLDFRDRANDIFLFIGSIEPRKNLERLIEAHASSGSTIPLILAGPLTAASTAIVQRANVHAGVRLLPYQDRTALMQLLGRARALLFPSLSEGFGLPIAEAMAMGTPVLTSQGGATEEIAESAALLVDPEDVTAIRDGIRRLAREDALCETLSSVGRQRARHFSMPAYGARLAALYRELLPR